MKTSLVLFTFAASLLAPAARAATFDELNGPLLGKGQWRLDADASLNSVSARNEASDVGSPDRKSAYNYTNYSLRPAGTYGLTDKLQLKLNDSYGPPYGYKYNNEAVPGGAYEHMELKSKFQNSLTAALTWRPTPAWDFYFTAGRSNSEQDMKYWELPYGSGTIRKNSQQALSQTLTGGAAWLSSPAAGGRTARNRADLDGLYNPLLNKGQAKADLALSYNWGSSRSALKEIRNTGATVATSGKGELHTFYVAPSFMYGILEQLQAEAAAGFYVPQTSDQKRERQTRVSSLGVVTNYASIRENTQLAEYYPSLKLTHRFSSRLQWYLGGDYTYRKEHSAAININETAGTTDKAGGTSGYETASATLGLNFISAPRQDGRPLAADLDGLKRPLLEKGQYQLDLSITANRERDWAAGDTSDAQANRSIGSKLTYGLTPALQAYVSLDATLWYRVRNSDTAKDVYPWNPTYGAGAAWRPSQTFQLFAEAAVNPANIHKGTGYDPTGAAVSSGRSEYDTTTVSVGATWLW